ncbi:MAG TPA: PglZ domain-containing protein [Prolixibacteraceae bacterium]|nr:PglZ domain-containing protein [Prolixibacteraceae bacterium]
MSWQSKIYYKYRLDEPVAKIISDDTGLLLSEPFLQYLTEEQKTFAVANSVSELMKSLSEPGIVILANQLNIPAFISNKNDVFYFRYPDIPVNGDKKLLEDLSIDELIALLDFVDAEQPHVILSIINLMDFLEKANNRTSLTHLDKLYTEISSITESPVNASELKKIGLRWAELQYQSYLLNNSDYLNGYARIDEYSNPYFESGNWQEAFFSPPANPGVVSQITSNLKQGKNQKNALLCFDCMGLPEWLLLKEYLSPLQLNFQESVLFSLIPSITSIARTAIYAGTWEVYEKSNPGQYTEEKDFKAFFGADDTLYLKEKEYTSSDVLIGFNAVSIIFNFFDDLSHSAHLQESNLNKFGYYNSVKDYLKNSKVLDIFKDLLQLGYAITICSDHGSTIAVGSGEKIDKYLHDKFAKRGTIIDKDSSDLISHKKISIPFIDNKLVVLPENREMFANKGQYEINHGGITIDEMLVPFVKISKK